VMMAYPSAKAGRARSTSTKYRSPGAGCRRAENPTRLS